MSWLLKDRVVIMKEIMSWLFRDPINSPLAQFRPCLIKQSKMAEKVQIAPNDVFSRKTTNKIFMFLLAPFILQN